MGFILKMGIDYKVNFTKSLSSLIKEKYQVSISDFEFQTTRKEFEGDITLLIYPLLKFIKINPEKLAQSIGQYLITNNKYVEKFNVVKGFLNLTLTDSFYLNEFKVIFSKSKYGHKPISMSSSTIMVEFSSPNTNKPLHLGHIRNNLLGYSISKILEANGNKVIKTQIINDRGIHICKSMVAWKKFGNGETPFSSKIKGDQLVGKYYVVFETEYKKEIETLVNKGKSEDYAKQNAPLIVEAKQMLKLWESNDPDVRSLWLKMNKWVYDGFTETYKKLGVHFDSYYYESNTYLLGKKIIDKGIKSGVFFKKEDGSVWIDLTDDGLDEKLLLRSDGTSVYMTQDLGTAYNRLEDIPDLNGMIYTVGNEQDYHFKVLFLILKKLGFNWSKSLYHLSYGMVDLPSGKMKSREGTVVDADNLICEMTNKAEDITESSGKLEFISKEERNSLYSTIGLGALKYYILKVDPKKRILFDPEASIDFNGNTGPFIQYTYARIKTLINNVKEKTFSIDESLKIENKEKQLIKHLGRYPEIIFLAGNQYSPAIIANYLYDLVKSYNTFYQNINILKTDNLKLQNFRIALSKKVAEVIKNASYLLGIEVPNRM